jgi:dTDP-4-amino-4,6-dideoxygalactose transaminase
MKFFEDPIIDSNAENLSKIFNDVMNSKMFVGNLSDKYIKEFKDNLKNEYSYDIVITCANGTDALTGSLKGINLQPGSYVAVPAISWLSTASCVFAAGCIPVYIDVDDSGLMDIEKFKIEIKRTPIKAIILVHLYGQLADVDSFKQIDKNILIIEDCAQAFGARFKDGSYVGTKGDLAAFSFFPTKNLGALGDAGMVVVKEDDEIKINTEMYFNNGQRNIKGFAFSQGVNSRMDSLQAAILNLKLSTFVKEKHALMRVQLLKKYLYYFDKIIFRDLNQGCPHLAVLKVNDPKLRDVLISEFNIANIPTAIHYQYALSDLRALQGVNSYECNCATEFVQKIISIPFHLNINEDSIQKMHKIYKNVIA